MDRMSVGTFLPGYEYVADGEPHVFGDRLYICGSHDRFGGKRFCENDYVGWSAPLNDLTDWRYEGVTYQKQQDPDNVAGKNELWAPDVLFGPDGRYYLYYCLADYPQIGVAVCDTPAGQYRFLGCVKDKTGVPLGRRPGDTSPFDPAVLLDEDGSIHLYAGQGPLNPAMARKRQKTHSHVYHAQLEPDMLTLRTEPVPLLPNVLNSAGTGFEGHEFFEASSIRKFEGRYYFIYSSVLSHELCWAVSTRPDGGFCYGGTLVSNGDIGLQGPVAVGYNSKANRGIKNYIGNNHGSVERVNGQYYVFYHRHTNRRMTSRQACVAPIEMLPGGAFRQAELTSSGLGGPLPGVGRYEARIACHLHSAAGAVYSAHPMVQNKKHPAFTQDEPDGQGGRQYIANLRQGATAGFKYFDLGAAKAIGVTLRGKGEGKLVVCDGEKNILAELSLVPGAQWQKHEATFAAKQGIGSLYFTYFGKGYVDFLEFELK